MFGVYLKSAMNEPGCPLCRLYRRAEERYVTHTLWENVNDMTFRLLFLGSDGLCPQHAWVFQQTEWADYHDGMKNGILYESLLNKVRREAAREAASREAATKPLRRPSILRRKPANDVPPKPCPVCEIRRQNEDFYSHELAKLLREEDWRALYRQSDGVCRPHLALVLAAAEPETAAWLTAETDERLAKLHRDLHEYLRKHSWQYRDEVVTEDEKRSWVRTIAFLRGERPEPLERQ